MPTNKQTAKSGNGEMEEVVVVQPKLQQPELPALFSRSPQKAFQEMEALVQMMSNKCTGPMFIAEVNGNQYPKVEWWTTIGSVLGLHPVTIYSRRIERKTAIVYESRVEVRYQDQIVAAGEALCSSDESNWKDADEYAIKSMSITRATGKAYRIPLSFLAVMSGLNPTNAEEVPSDTFEKPPEPATVKQLDYLLWLSQQKYGDHEGYLRIEHHAQVKYGHDKGIELLKSEASRMIDTLMKDKDLLALPKE